MSEQPIDTEARGSAAEPASPADQSNVPPRSRQELNQLWLQASGWLVMCMGAVEIIGAIHIHRLGEMPLLFMLGLVLMGAAAILAGQSITEGYAWGLPLVALMFGLNLMTLVLGYALYRVARTAAANNVLRLELSGNARPAYSLWIGGFGCMMLGLILSI